MKKINSEKNNKSRSHWIGWSDILLMAGICTFAVVLLVIFVIQNRSADKNGLPMLQVIIRNEVVDTYSLEESQTVELETGNIFEVRDGEVQMLSADCPDQTCVHSKSISKSGESIVCLPHEVILKISVEKNHDDENLSENMEIDTIVG